VNAFTPLLQLKDEDEFTWGAKQQEAFDEVKRYLSSPPVLRAPRRGTPFKLYVAAEDCVIGAVLTQETEGKEYIITYASRRLLDAETRYTFIEKLCLSLYYACTKLRHYLLSNTCIVACQTDIIKYMLHRPILSGRIGKWAYALIEYDLICEPLKSMKGQVVANFIVQHSIDKQLDLNVGYLTFTPWKLHFDGSVCKSGCGVGVIIISPNGAIFEALNRLDRVCTNNQTEYEALLFGSEILHDMGVKHIEAYGDSLLVVQQVSKVCQCLDGVLNAYLDKCLDIIACLDEFVIYHVPREENPRANALAQQASGYDVQKRNFRERKPMFSEAEVLALDQAVQPPCTAGLTAPGGLTACTAGLTACTLKNPDSAIVASKTVEAELGDWRKPLVDYLRDPSCSVDRKVRRWAFKFTLVDGELYRRTADDLLLKCLGPDQARLAMAEVHEGICGTHQSARMMKWLLRRACFYWPAMIADCFRYYKGCEECQRFGDVQLVPAALMHPIIKPWPFRGWGLDFVGKIHPPSSKGHCFVIVATDYFTKWTEAIPLKNMTHREVIEFITEHIIHRFGIPQTLTTDQGTSFVSKEVREFVESYGINLLNSSPYYAQANGQAESSNKILVKLIKKKIE
jgi:ribonuclease HI